MGSTQVEEGHYVVDIVGPQQSCDRSTVAIATETPYRTSASLLFVLFAGLFMPKLLLVHAIAQLSSSHHQARVWGFISVLLYIVYVIYFYSEKSYRMGDVFVMPELIFDALRR